MTDKYLSIGNLLNFLTNANYPLVELTVVVQDQDVAIDFTSIEPPREIYQTIVNYAVDSFNTQLKQSDGTMCAGITIVAHKKQEK